MSLTPARRPTVTRSPDSSAVPSLSPSGPETTASAPRPGSPWERDSIDRLTHVDTLQRARLHPGREGARTAQQDGDELGARRRLCLGRTQPLGEVSAGGSAWSYAAGCRSIAAWTCGLATMRSASRFGYAFRFCSARC